MTDAPVVKPDLSAATVDKAVTDIGTAAKPFIPAKLRATIYTVGGLIGVVTIASSPVFGGTLGEVLGGIGAAATALTSTLAVSHITK
jgi:hypothetical protein